ncbi:MAG: hypothetical protein J5829_08265 [Lachnospiraceae bacterium]|nr:hypothetical protein [Lachnospiraceae bacterium]
MKELSERIDMLNDDMLENVSGGTERPNYSNAELTKAGVMVKNIDGKKVYQTMLSTGKTLNLTQGEALSMVDCYNISGGVKLNDQQIKDLISQS